MKSIVVRIFIIIFAAGHLISAEYHVDRSKDNLVKFISDAPMEDFEGITDHIDGYLLWDPENPLEKGDMYFEVDLNSIDTGIGLRNRHMRENYLHTDKYPYAKFNGKLTAAEMTDENEYRVTATGTMSIHGIDREIEVNGTLTDKDDTLNIHTEFVVSLTDYNIEIPQIMFLKIEEDMQLVLDFYLLQYQEK